MQNRSKPIEFGSFSDTEYLSGNRQSPPAPSSGVNIAGSGETVKAVEARMVPDFQGASGQGANREYIARKDGN